VIKNMSILRRIIDSLAQIKTSISGISVPTAGQNADAVWDEATAGHAGAGTTGKALTDILAGIGGVLSSKINIIEAHIHPISIFITGEPSVLNAVTTGGADTFGNWTKITDASALPAVGNYFDLHQHLIRQASLNKTYDIEIGYGDIGGTIEQIGYFTFYRETAEGNTPPIYSPGSRILSDGISHIYVRAKADTLQTGTFYYRGIGYIY